MSKDKSFSAAIKPPSANAPRKKQPRRIKPEYLHNSGLYYLQRFASSASNFRTVMLRKVRRSCMAHPDQDFEACRAMVEDLVRKFEAVGLLDDVAYLRGTVASLRRRGLSRQAIVFKLKSKGFSTDTVLASLREFDADHGIEDQDAELTAALRHARRKRLGPFGSHGKETFEKELASLARKGFSYETSRIVLQMNREEAEIKLEARAPV